MSGVPAPAVVILLFASGMTRSMQFTALNTLAFAEVPETWMSGANTLFNMVQQMGVALGAAALRIAALVHPAAPGAIPLAHFRLAFILVGVIALLETFDLVGLDPAAGDSVRSRRPIPKPAFGGTEPDR
jgi:hypothetical protein